MIALKNTLIIILTLTLCSCGPKPFDCTSEQATAVIEKIIRDQIEKTSVERGKNDDGTNGVSESKARATVAQLKVVLELVRTTKSDPDSTKKFCAGNVKVIFPISMITEASNAREAAKLNSVPQLAENSGLKVNGNAYHFDIEYNIQPTDDKKNTIGEIENIGEEYIALAEIVNSHVFSKVILENAKVSEAAEAAQRSEAESNIALQNQAALDMATSGNKLADQALNEIWSSLPSEVRQDQIDYQRAWINKKKADCNIEAAESATDPSLRESARLTCDTRLTNIRSNELKSMLNG